MIKLGRMRCAGHVAHMGEKKYRVLMGILEKTDHLKDLDIAGRTILKRILKNFDGRASAGSIRLKTGTSGRLL
jgi:hypothetical protein